MRESLNQSLESANDYDRDVEGIIARKVVESSFRYS